MVAGGSSPEIAGWHTAPLRHVWRLSSDRCSNSGTWPYLFWFFLFTLIALLVLFPHLFEQLIVLYDLQSSSWKHDSAHFFILSRLWLHWSYRGVQIGCGSAAPASCWEFERWISTWERENQHIRHLFDTLHVHSVQHNNRKYLNCNNWLWCIQTSLENKSLVLHLSDHQAQCSGAELCAGSQAWGVSTSDLDDTRRNATWRFLIEWSLVGSEAWLKGLEHTWFT